MKILYVIYKIKKVNYVENDPKNKKVNVLLYHPDTKHLLTIRPKTDDIYIEPSEDSQLWQVVRNSQDQGIGSLVREKDIIKLGKKTFLITKIKDSDEAGFHYKKNSKKISTLTATYISENNDIEENDERAN